MLIKFLFIIGMFGIYYYMFESIFNCFISNRNKIFVEHDFRLIGMSSLWMILVGSLTGATIYFIYLIPLVHNSIPIIFLIILFGVVITGYELLTGILLDTLLKIRLWNYSNEFLNYKGYISLPRCLAWSLLVPIILWISDNFNYILFSKGNITWLLNYYTRIVSDFIK